MVQADAIGHEALVPLFFTCALDADRRAAADVIEEIVAVIDLGEAEERQQLAVEGTRLVPLADRQDDVRHAVHFDHVLSCRVVVYGTGHGFTPQISAAYSAMVRSLENLPELAMFRMALRAHACGSAYSSSSRRSAL